MNFKQKTTQAGPFRDTPAFTLTELLVVLTILFLLLTLHVAANSRRKGQSEAAVCMNNLRQLTVAWNLYARDHRDSLPGNLDGGDAFNWANSNRTWCVGWLDAGIFRPDNTNEDLLLNSQLGPYVPSAAIYKCPSDPSRSEGLSGPPRVRSISMNSYMGQRAAPYSSGYQQFRTLAQITEPAPSRAFVFVDERPDSLNDGCLFISMSGYSPIDPTAYILVDYPAEWHEDGANLSFVDGHVENWHWQDARTMPTYYPGRLIPLNISSPNNPDVGRLLRSSTSHVKR